MLIGERLRELRIDKRLGQSDVEKRTGLKRCYISRVENGHTIPTLDTLEKWTRALEVPLYQVLYGIEHTPDRRNKNEAKRVMTAYERRLVRLLARMDERRRMLLFEMAQKMARR